MSLTTIRRLHSLAGLPFGITFHDAALGLCADIANSHVFRRIGQPALGLTTRTEYPEVSRESQYRIVLRRWPVDSVVTITNGGSALAADQYRLDSERGWIDLVQGSIGSRAYLAAWSPIPGDVAVTYLHGWTDTTVPDDLRGAADLIGLQLFRRIKHAGADSETIGKHRIDLSNEPIPPEAQRILAGYVDVF